jgi:Na+-translocating ferredoxin:NAD+ oxidoreductase RnfE subunit
MREEGNTILLTREGPLVLAIGLIAPLMVRSSLRDALTLGIAAACALFPLTLFLAFAVRRIPFAARIGAAVFTAAGVVAMAKIAVGRYCAVPVETIAPLLIVVAVLGVTNDVYRTKKRIVPPLLDAAGIGAVFSLLLISVSALRSAVIPAASSAKTGALLYAPAGIFIALAALLLIVSAGARQKKGGES